VVKMALLAVMNIPELLGLRSEYQVMKRFNCKLDALLAVALTLVGMVVMMVSFTSDKVACVPVECVDQPGNPSCARNWDYQSNRCEYEVLAYPDINFHILLLVKSLLFLTLIILPIFYGNNLCIELFTNFSSLWKLRNDEAVTKSVEWKRKMHLQLEQLKTSTTLTRQYAIYHSIGAALDGFSLLTIVLHTLHFSDFDVPHFGSVGFDGTLLTKATNYFSMTKPLCQNETFFCEMPNRNIFKWFGIVTSLLLLVKLVNRLLCIGFTFGLPGLFGRNILLYADMITNRNSEKVFQIQRNPFSALAQASASLLHLLIVVPLKMLLSFFNFYFYSLSSMSAKNEIAEDQTLQALEVLEPKEDLPTSEGTQTLPARDSSKPVSYQNWSDMFFILDVMSGYIDICEILIFISKTNDLIVGIEDKKVDIHSSRLDLSLNTLSLNFTSCGAIEKLMDLELSGAGGLKIQGWLEGPTGKVVQNPQEDDTGVLTFNIVHGATYELISAVFARDRQLSRLRNYSIHVPQELRARQKKKYGTNLPLAALLQSEGHRPLSLSFDLGGK